MATERRKVPPPPDVEERVNDDFVWRVTLKCLDGTLIGSTEDVYVEPGPVSEVTLFADFGNREDDGCRFGAEHCIDESWSAMPYRPTGKVAVGIFVTRETDSSWI